MNSTPLVYRSPNTSVWQFSIASNSRTYQCWFLMEGKTLSSKEQSKEPTHSTSSESNAFHIRGRRRLSLLHQPSTAVRTRELTMVTVLYYFRSSERISGNSSVCSKRRIEWANHELQRWVETSYLSHPPPRTRLGSRFGCRLIGELLANVVVRTWSH